MQGHRVTSICLSGPDDPRIGHRRGWLCRLGCKINKVHVPYMQEISFSIVIVAISYPSWEDGLNHNAVMDDVECHCPVTGIPYLQVDVADTTRCQQQAIPVYPIVGKEVSALSAIMRSLQNLLRDG